MAFFMMIVDMPGVEVCVQTGMSWEELWDEQPAVNVDPGVAWEDLWDVAGDEVTTTTEETDGGKEAESWAWEWADAFEDLWWVALAKALAPRDHWVNQVD